MKLFKLSSGPMHWYHYAIIALTITGGVSLIAYANRSDNSQANHAEPSQQKEYEYAELGSLCNLGAIKLKQKGEALQAQAEKDYSQVNSELAQTEAQLSANSAYNTQSLNNARSGYYDVYEQGGSSSQEYRERSNNISGVQSGLYSQAGNIQSEINRLRTENAKHYEESKKRSSEFLADASKLETCAASAVSEKDFTVSDVAEFEALISKSEQP